MSIKLLLGFNCMTRLREIGKIYPLPQRRLGFMATKTGREVMDPNARWERREEGKAIMEHSVELCSQGQGPSCGQPAPPEPPRGVR